MRWQMKLWRSVGMLIESRNKWKRNEIALSEASHDAELRIAEDTNYCIKQVGRSLYLMYYYVLLPAFS